ncbi:MAG: sugar phosphate isomerase/epimerase [Clostridia bacterium]|nr:sugar phosphate isomerase/epimerase [Clostridia bacterium]
MAKFFLSAFADEYSSEIDKQIEGLLENGVKGIEIRGVDGTNIADITLEKAEEIKAKFDKAGIKVTSIGSPIGKIKLADDFEAHLDKLRHVIAIAKILGTEKIRMFSFYMENGADYAACRAEVMEKLGKMLEIAKAEGITLCHENEKGIYGDNAERCLDIQKEFGGEIKCIFDPANFIECEVETYPHAFNILKDYIYYFHIKDAFGMGKIVPAGEGMGHIPEIMAEADKLYDREVILTVEPHLTNFDGFAALEKDGVTDFKKDKSNSEVTFGIACSAIKKIIAK